MKTFQTIFAFVIIFVLIFLGYKLLGSVWDVFVGLDKQVAVSLLTAFTTIFVATLTVTLGRYFERRKEIESHFRKQKIDMYDSMLQELFKTILASEGSNKQDNGQDLVEFLKEWQRKMVLWGGSPVLAAYIKWIKHLRAGVPDAQTFFLMDNFFRAMRKDIGLGNSGLEKGTFTHLLLSNSSLLLAEAKKNPNITLEELSQLEEELDE